MTIEQLMPLPEMRARNVPVEILGFQVYGEDVGKQRIEGAGDVPGGRGAEVGRGVEGRLAALDGLGLVLGFQALLFGFCFHAANSGRVTPSSIRQPYAHGITHLRSRAEGTHASGYAPVQEFSRSTRGKRARTATALQATLRF